MEINATVTLSVADTVPGDGYDFESIVTHEAGHFLGMAHSGDERATMFAHYAAGSSSMRTLTDDDVTGICRIYLPDGTRSVDPSVPGAKHGHLTETTCNPTPRHGFSSQCAGSSGKACAASLGSSVAGLRPDGSTPLGLACVGVSLFFLGLRPLRRLRPSAPLRGRPYG